MCWITHFQPSFGCNKIHLLRRLPNALSRPKFNVYKGAPYGCTLIILRLSSIWKVPTLKKYFWRTPLLKFYSVPPSEQTCPCYGAKTKRIHDYHLQEVHDSPLQGKQVILVLRKRRYLLPPATNVLRNHTRFYPATIAGPTDLLSTLFPYFANPFP